MLPILFAGIVATSGLASDLAAYEKQIKTTCQAGVDNLRETLGMVAPKGVCACFARNAIQEAGSLRPRERAVFLILVEADGKPGGAQKMAEARLNVSVEDFTAMWDRLKAIGDSAAKVCSGRAAAKPRPG